MIKLSTRAALLLSITNMEEIADRQDVPEEVISSCRSTAKAGRETLGLPERGKGRFAVKEFVEIGPHGICSPFPLFLTNSWAEGYEYVQGRQGRFTIEYTEPPECGDFDWDRWEEKAKAEGVPEGLAMIGRALYREAYQHSWPLTHQAACGWKDEGEEMLRLAKSDPQKARDQWQALLDTDGGRVPPIEER